MGKTTNGAKNFSTDERELLVAYLSYALEDVRALSANALHLLQLTIATISEEAVTGHSNPTSAVVSWN
jgi:hypothetical protein